MVSGKGCESFLVHPDPQRNQLPDALRPHAPTGVRSDHQSSFIERVVVVVVLRSRSGDPVEDCESLVRWYFWFLADNPSFVRLLGWETLSDGRRAGEVLVDLMEEGLGPLQEIISRGKAHGHMRKEIAVHKLIASINDMCLGFFSRMNLLEVLWEQDLRSRDKQQEMLDHIVAVLLDGIRIK